MRLRRPLGAVTVEAAAKVNLGWRVGDVRPDGFHEVAGLVQTITLRDRLDVRAEAPGPQAVTADVEGEPVGLVVDGPEATPDLLAEGNLVLAAARLVGERFVPRPTTIRLRKDIPVASGLGGGSADAAAALVGLGALWGARLAAADHVELGAELGSDVPAVLLGGLVHASGRGERVRGLGCATGTWFVLGVPDARISAADAYRVLDELRAAGRAEDDASWHRNDLEAAAVRLVPGLGDALDAMRSAGAPVACVSGSGPAVAGILGDRASAEDVASRASPAFRRVVVAEASAWGVRLTMGTPADAP